MKLRAITGHEAEMAAQEDAELIPTQKFLLRIRRDNSTAELANPSLALGWQEDGSVVFEASIVARDSERQVCQQRLLSTIYRFSFVPGNDWLAEYPAGFEDYFLGFEIGPGKIYYLDVSRKTITSMLKINGTKKVTCVREINALTEDAMQKICVGHHKKDGVVVYNRIGYIKCKNVHVATRVRDEEVLDDVLKKLSVCWKNFDYWKWDRARETDDFTVSGFILKEIKEGRARFEEVTPVPADEDGEWAEEII
jgi:hypothetical protein